ncbi:hypothetical protein HOV93_06020 [Planctomycetes bacterium FF15]|uniref:Uncharacterized protein n=1 Tax=Bremerella alba TaxID=980252 RepID=A0A7V9A5Q4_9BACT|nr:hypothetical protein [Bremerella alba]
MPEKHSLTVPPVVWVADLDLSNQYKSEAGEIRELRSTVFLSAVDLFVPQIA